MSDHATVLRALYLRLCERYLDASIAASHGAYNKGLCDDCDRAGALAEIIRSVAVRRINDPLAWIENSAAFHTKQARTEAQHKAALLLYQEAAQLVREVLAGSPGTTP